MDKLMRSENELERPVLFASLRILYFESICNSFTRDANPM
jgi:hypothetical protein